MGLFTYMRVSTCHFYSFTGCHSEDDEMSEFEVSRYIKAVNQKSAGFSNAVPYTVVNVNDYSVIRQPKLDQASNR